MNKVIDITDFLFDTDIDFEEDESLPSVEDIIDDKSALEYMGEDAVEVLLSGYHHRKLSIRIKSASMLSELFPNEKTMKLFESTIVNRSESRVFRFHVARHVQDLNQDMDETILSLSESKGCNDRICSMILMGCMRTSHHTFLLQRFLEDSNDVVKVAAFLSLMKYSNKSLASTLQLFLNQATLLHVELIKKSLTYFEDNCHYIMVNELLNARFDSLQQNNLRYHPYYYEQSYSQEKLSKLDRHPAASGDFKQEEKLVLFDI
ncbi:MAG: hypothetical protein COB02_13170 [Candidatus Cloacimonadota bacterium]|nr:MAG: hypothetical protein COB02_13170 [Candidatus Cloacimonadota bacterium]